jgi:hypothetical protein
MAQTLTFLLTDVVSIAFASLQHLRSTSSQGWPSPRGGGGHLETPLGGRDGTHIFVEVLLVGVTGASVAAARLLAAMRRTRKVGRERREQGLKASAADAEGTAVGGQPALIMHY